MRQGDPGLPLLLPRRVPPGQGAPWAGGRAGGRAVRGAPGWGGDFSGELPGRFLAFHGLSRARRGGSGVGLAANEARGRVRGGPAPGWMQLVSAGSEPGVSHLRPTCPVQPSTAVNVAQHETVNFKRYEIFLV